MSAHYLAQAFFKLVPFHDVSIRLLSALAETLVGSTFQIRCYCKQVLNFTARIMARLPTPKSLVQLAKQSLAPFDTLRMTASFHTVISLSVAR
jgi:hypothetical protein